MASVAGDAGGAIGLEPRPLAPSQWHFWRLASYHGGRAAETGPPERGRNAGRGARGVLRFDVGGQLKVGVRVQVLAEPFADKFGILERPRVTGACRGTGAGKERNLVGGNIESPRLR